MDGDVRIISRGRMGLLAILLTVLLILAPIMRTASINGDGGVPAGGGVSSDVIAGAATGEDSISNSGGD